MMRKNTVIFVGAVLAMVGLYYLFLSHYLTIDNLKYYRHTLLDGVQKHYSFSVFLYIGAYALGIAFCLPVASLFTLTGGFLFGVIFGSLYALIGATIGATLAFLLVRYIIGDWFQERFEKRLTFVNRELEKRGAFYLIALRFFAIIPFFVLNIVAGLTKIPLSTFIVTTALGIIPGCIVFAYAGKNLGRIESMQDIVSPSVLTAFGLLALLALVPLLFRKRIAPSTQDDT